MLLGAGRGSDAGGAGRDQECRARLLRERLRGMAHLLGTDIG